MDFLPLLLKPWPVRGLAFVLGALGALAFAPLFLFPAILLSFSCIWFLLDQEIKNKSSFLKIFLLGWWFGLGHFTVGLYWIAYALTVDIETFWWLVPFALFGIPSVLAIFTGLTFILTKLWPYHGISRSFAFVAIWVASEWLRGHIFTGFPWNLLGYTWAFSLEMIQIVSLTSVYGLSLLTLLLAISLTYLVGKRAFERNIALCICLVTVICWTWGRDRLNHPNVLTAPSLAIRLVQPNIPQTLKWDPVQQEANLQGLLQLTAKPSILPIKAIIWPETAVSFFLEYDTALRGKIAETIPKNSLLFTGALRRTPPGKTPLEIWNSLIVLNNLGNIVAFYDKSHLVPFGEYLPFRALFDTFFGKGSVKKITAGAIDFTAGSGPQSIALSEGLPPFSGLVCYEVIFPRAVVNSTRPRPGWMINVTNDGWYGKTSGPYQHFEMTRFRAIEEGIPLVRVANTGISTAFDSYGRSLGKISLGEKGVLDLFLPTPTHFVPLYAQWGDWIPLILIITIFSLALIFSLKGQNDE